MYHPFGAAPVRGRLSDCLRPVTAIYLCLFPSFALGGTWHVAPYDVDPPIQIDGKLDDWAEVPNKLELRQREQVTLGQEDWDGPDDLSGAIHLAWRSDGIVIAAEVIDDVVSQPYSNQALYRGDHVNLFLDFLPGDDPDRNALSDGQFHIGLSPGSLTDDGGVPAEIFFFAPEGLDHQGMCRIASSRTRTGYILEAHIPCRVLGQKELVQGKDINYTVALSDSDRSEALQESWMTPGTREWAYGRHMFDTLVFGDGNGKGEPKARRVPVHDHIEIEPQQSRTLSFTLNQIPEGKIPHLFFRGRVNHHAVGGFVTNALTVDLNGEPVRGDQLSNREPTGTMMRGDQDTYVTSDGRIVLWYSPDFEAVDRHAHYRLIDDVKACEYEFCLADLKPGRHELTFHNRAEPMPDIERKAVIGDIEILLKQPAPPKTYAPAPAGPLDIYEPKGSGGKSYSQFKSSGARLELNAGKDPFVIQSRFSAPDGQWHEESTRQYHHRRETERHDGWIVVRDTFENLTDEDVPIVQEHQALAPRGYEDIWLSGIRLPSGVGQRSMPENPSLFGTTRSAGIGLVALNDVFRVHVVTTAAEGKLTLSDPSFVLRAGSTYTAEWAIVPVETPDFWSFVNAARRMLDVNFTLDLNFTFVFYHEPIYEWTDQRFEDFVRFKSANFVVQSNEASRYKGDYAYARAFQAVTRRPYVDFQKRVRRQFPDGDVMTGIYYHCFIDNYREEDDAAFADARIIDSAGQHMTYGGQHVTDKLYCPTDENAFGRVTGTNIDIIQEEIGANGIFWDEHQISRVKYTYNPASWDGCSADIDPETFRIVRKKSSVALLSLSWRHAKAKRIMARGPLITNGAPHTRTMLNLRYPAFTETGSLSYCGKMLLHSPMGLGDHLTVKTQLQAYQFMRKVLDQGCLYAWYSHHVIPTYPTLTEHMFPFTPIELHAGYVIGEERILTNRSGLFGWGDESLFEAYVYDREGRKTDEVQVPRVMRERKAYAEVRLPEGYSAAVVRKIGNRN